MPWKSVEMNPQSNVCNSQMVAIIGQYMRMYLMLTRRRLGWKDVTMQDTGVTLP
jgi:hypothetical protein